MFAQIRPQYWPHNQFRISNPTSFSLLLIQSYHKVPPHPIPYQIHLNQSRNKSINQPAYPSSIRPTQPYTHTANARHLTYPSQPSKHPSPPKSKLNTPKRCFYFDSLHTKTPRNPAYNLIYTLT